MKLFTQVSEFNRGCNVKRSCRWSWELGVVIVLDLILACCGLYLLVLYLRLDAAAKKFVWSQLGRFCALVTLSALLTSTGRFARLQNQIT
jgi:di/tricarboxylate transporter